MKLTHYDLLNSLYYYCPKIIKDLYDIEYYMTLNKNNDILIREQGTGKPL